jgi:CheY-like chemotaxis protein
MMPVMGGYEAAAGIRSLPDPDKAAVPIIGISANAFREDREKALAAGMNDYLAKPVDVEELAAALEKAAGRLEGTEA